VARLAVGSAAAGHLTGNGGPGDPDATAKSLGILMLAGVRVARID